jgi:3-oxoacyl-[acyl-carrier-protein] synthase II
VPGEGAGILVLEELEHAQKRNANIHAEVVGVGAAFDAKRNGDGLARAIQMALRHAGIAPEDVDHVNAQGFSTRREDGWEARGIHKAFGGAPVPVFAGKSYHGSLGAASGGVELTASILALKHGILPPTLNHEDPDPECPIKVLAGQAREVQKSHALKVSFTEMGQCAAVVIKKW